MKWKKRSSNSKENLNKLINISLLFETLEKKNLTKQKNEEAEGGG